MLLRLLLINHTQFPQIYKQTIYHILQTMWPTRLQDETMFEKYQVPYSSLQKKLNTSMAIKHKALPDPYIGALAYKAHDQFLRKKGF